MRALLLAAAVAVATWACAGAPPAPVPTPAAAAPPTTQGAIRTARFHAASLGVSKRYLVYLPAGYDESDRRYPVVYLLHGLGGSETSWRDVGIAAAADALGFEALIVMPDGDDGFYVNWASDVDHAACLDSVRPFGKPADMRTYCVKQARYEDYIVRDLVDHVDATYRTDPRREARAIAGLSMGGYGALYLAFSHAELFGAVASHAGVASLLYRGPHPYERDRVQLTDDPRTWIDQSRPFGPHFRRIWGEDIATWRAHDPATLARALPDHRLAIYLDCGDRDEFLLHDANRYLHDVLTDHGITHTFHLVEGGRHDTAYWRARIDHSLTFLATYVTAL